MGQHLRGGERSTGPDSAGDGAQGTPGKTTLTAGMTPSRAVQRSPADGGSPLPAPLQDRFEGSLGTSLAGVRVHTGGESDAAARSMDARAYTVGSDIHFAAGQYKPDDPFGVHLLAHEVAHTAQQGGAPRAAQAKLAVSAPGDAFEAEADAAADAMVRGAPARVSPVAPVIARAAPAKARRPRPRSRPTTSTR